MFFDVLANDDYLPNLLSVFASDVSIAANDPLGKGEFGVVFAVMMLNDEKDEGENEHVPPSEETIESSPLRRWCERW